MNHSTGKGKYEPIENYGIIGNGHTVALVSGNGSIDYMCFTRFDSPTIFCKILDVEKGGSFSIEPQMNDFVTKQLYLPDTNVLVTRFLAEEGIAEVIDYMPVSPKENTCALIRRITNIRGKIEYKIRCAPRLHYASHKHTLQETEQGFEIISEKSQGAGFLLSAEFKLEADGNDVIASFSLKEGETTCIILETQENRDAREDSICEYVGRTYRETVTFWQGWIAKSNYTGNWKEMVHRSALTLKLLISGSNGSMVAAPTFSLPESIGNGRNWDYRFTWIRDAAFSMHAFLQLGFMEEAEAFLGWVKKQSSNKKLQLMFSVDGDTRLDEQKLDYLEGYKKSSPVRIGNDASRQTQMDIYGELLETFYIYAAHGGNITYDYWKIITRYVEFVIGNWHKPDHSIWEVRGKKREFLFSRMMCWVALDRALKIAEIFSFPHKQQKWREVRDEIYEDIYNNFWSEKKKAFAQYKGGNQLDASAMLLPIFNIISPFSERWEDTMKAIDKELKSDVLLYRYREDESEIDGIQGTEGTFTMCSFWHVECLALAGKKELAREQFEKMLGYANHLGLFAEQLGMKGQHLGNFPQAFTHLALISAAIELGQDKKSHSINVKNNTSSNMK